MTHIDFKYIDFWYIDKLHIWLFDTLTKETWLITGYPGFRQYFVRSDNFLCISVGPRPHGNFDPFVGPMNKYNIWSAIKVNQTSTMTMTISES